MSQTTLMSPLGFAVRKWIRISAILVIVLGVAAAIFGVAARLNPALTIGDLLANPGQVGVLTAVLLLYSSYLLLVVNHGLLQREISEIGGLASVMPLLLLFAYLSVPLEYWIANKQSNLSTIALMLVYVLWLAGGLSKFARRSKRPATQLELAEQVVWLFVDVLAISVLSIDLAAGLAPLQSGVPGPRKVYALGVGLDLKDLSVALSVVGCLAQAVILHLANKRPFPDAITKFISALRADPATDRGLAPAESWARERFGDSPIRVFDFGSGDSRRTIATLERLGISRERIALDRYDILREWEDYGPTANSSEQLREVSFTSDFRTAKARIREADLVVASHSLYDASAVADFARLLKSATRRPPIVLRGGAPTSFLAPIVIYRLYSWMRPFFSACWDSDGIMHLCAAAELRKVQLDGHASGQPLVLGQVVAVRQDMLTSIEQAVEYQYGRRVAMTIRRMARMALERTPGHQGVREITLPNPDLVYLLEYVGAASDGRASSARSHVDEFGDLRPDGTRPEIRKEYDQPAVPPGKDGNAGPEAGGGSGISPPPG